MDEITPTTFQVSDPNSTIEAVIGDEKQTMFFPRLKIKKWDNDANFSIGLADTTGTYALSGNQVNFQGTQNASFYPTGDSVPPSVQISFQNLGAISPTRIGSIYELNRYFPEDNLTVNLHWSNCYAMMYYGYYDRDSYIDPTKLDLPEMRVSSFPMQNGPMVMDETLKLVDVRYSELRDDTVKIHQATIQAVTQNVEKYGLTVVKRSDDAADYKLYFLDGDKRVKFFSTAFVGGHYYYYINLGIDYNQSHTYYRDDITPQTQDIYAYGLRNANPDIPDSILTDIISDFADLYGLPLAEQTYSDAETTKLAALDTIHSDPNWIQHAERTDCYDSVAPNFQANDGFEFAITLTSKPDTNQIPLTLQSKNVKFHYQNELTTDEKVIKNRPQNTIDSWAVYHVDKQDNSYETGKAFHIYRLWAQDNTGQRVWCSLRLNVDNDGNLLSNDASIEVPQDFLDSASYPVLIDPTFGYTTQGASSVTSGGTTVYGIPATPSNTGTLQKVSMYILQADTSMSSQVGVYTASNSTKLVGSNTFTSTINPAAAHDFTLSSQPSISTISYNLVAAQTSGNYELFYYDTVTSAGVQASWTYSNTNNAMPSTLTFTTNNDKLSIWGTYNATVSLTATQTFTGGFAKQTCIPQTGSLSFAGAFARQINKLLGASISFAGAIQRFISHLMAAVQSFTSSMTRTVTKIIPAATLSFAGSLAGGHLFNKVLAAAGLSFNTITGSPNIIDSYSESHQTTTVNVNGSSVGRGQSFTGNGVTVGSTTFYLKAGGSPTGSAFAKIYAHTGTFGTSSVPTGTALAISDALDISTLTASFALVNITFSGANQITLTNGTHYVITLESSNTTNTNFVVMGADNVSPSAPGNESSYNGTTWGSASTFDLCFYVYDNGGSSMVVSLFKQTQKALSAGVTFTGAIQRAIKHGLSAALSFSGLIQRLITHSVVVAALSFAGSMTKASRKSIVASLSFAGTIKRFTSRQLMAVITFTGNIFKFIKHSVAATLSFVGNLASSLSSGITNFTQLLSGSLSFSGQITRKTNYSLIAGLSFTGGLLRRISKTIAAGLSFIGTIIAGSLITIPLTAVLSFVGSTSKRMNKSIIAAVSFSGVIKRTITKTITASLGFIGNWTRHIAFLRGLTATLTFNGTTTKTISKSFAASVGFVGSLVTVFRQLLGFKSSSIRQVPTESILRNNAITTDLTDRPNDTVLRGGQTTTDLVDKPNDTILK